MMKKLACAAAALMTATLATSVVAADMAKERKNAQAACKSTVARRMIVRVP